MKTNKPDDQLKHGGVAVERMVLRRQMIEQLKKQVDWIDEKDPKRQYANMQGARYAYLLCVKWLKKNL